MDHALNIDMHKIIEYYFTFFNKSVRLIGLYITCPADPNERVHAYIDDNAGLATLTIKDVTKVDEHTFACAVSRQGSSQEITLEILGY